MKEQKSIIIYQCWLDEFSGVCTFLYNFCINLRNYYDITVLYDDGEENQIKRIGQFVKTEKRDKSKTYTADIVLRNSAWGDAPNNLISKDNRYLEMRHADYKNLLEKGLLTKQFYRWDKTNEVIGCGEFVSKRSNEVLKDNPTTIINILAPKVKTNRIFRFISCTRLSSDKGWGRMQRMAQMMRDANIKFEWNIFTPNTQKCRFEEIHFYRPTHDFWDYLAAADYTVLLSDSEGLPYTIQESLQYKVPCIVTDVGGCTELIKDGENGYIVPLDMNFDINKIKVIPKCKAYNNHAKEKWLEYLGDSEYIDKGNIEDKFAIISPKYYLVQALPIYEKLMIMDSILGRIPKAGDVWEVDDNRLRTLVKNNPYRIPLVKIVKEIK